MANTTERIGVYHCAILAEKNNWLFREQPIDDVGIDAHMEFIDTNGNPKQLLGLQIKSGVSWFNEEKDGLIIFRKINERQYNYWTTNSLPCILVLFNPETEMCVWEKLTVNTVKRTSGGKGFFVEVPKNQVFIDNSANNKLQTFSNLPDHIINYNFLLSQKKFMQIINSGGKVKLHSEEWVNKSSGRGDTELIVVEGDVETRYPYPYWFPFTSYTEVFPKLFPWASFSADPEFFQEYDEANWREFNTWYDREEDRFIQIGEESFEDYRDGLNPMRSIDHMGEVAEYMMILGLNELGKSFLEVERYIQDQRPYVNVRIDETGENND